MATVTNRRSFFDTLLGQSNTRAVHSLKELDRPLTKIDIYHLLKRCCFAVDPVYAKSLIGKNAKSAVNELINNAKNKTIPLPPFDVNEGFISPENLSGEAKDKQRYDNLIAHFEQNGQLVSWWLDLMKGDKNSLSEKLTFLWHSHFTTQYEGNEPIPAQFIYRQNLLFRQQYLSNFQTFLEKVTIDGAMLLYLNGSSNSRLAPNENYARELLELFSVGIGEGHYSEEDIREAAKILTAWRVNYYTGEGDLYKPFLDPTLFSTESKTVFGVSFTVDYTVTQENVYKNSIQKLMAAVLDKKADEASQFLAQKFYKFFVYSKPQEQPNETVKLLAGFFVSSGYNIKETIVKLLSSQHFFDESNYGIQIKSPLENLLGFAAHFDVDTEQLYKWTVSFGQEPLNPPNVSGWKGYRSWITTKSLPTYIFVFNEILNKQGDEKIGDWAIKNIDNYEDSYMLVENITLLFLGKIPNELRLEKLHKLLLGSAPYYEWPELAQNKSNAGIRIKVLLKEMFRMPDFYLS
ncbi:MAG: hypothetical protein ACI9K1_002125 [Arcticibacterium sp.]|jgi:uncharacterized protein (DUF1800 family)